jgi:cell division protein FtsQ
VAAARPQQRGHARSAVIPLPPRADPAAFLRLLPSGRSLLVGFAIVAGAAALYVLARATPMFAVRRIEVEGAPPAVAGHVRAALAPLESTSLLALDRADIDRRLERLTDVAGARYDRDFPHTLRVVVRPERPVAIARRGAEAWLVSGSARVIASAKARARPGLPRVWLTGSGEPEVGAAISDRLGIRAVRTLASARLAHFRPRIRMVRTREHELTFLLATGLQLRLGDLRAVPLKLAVAARVLPEVLSQHGYAYLDVSVPVRPVAGANPQVEG